MSAIDYQRMTREELINELMQLREEMARDAMAMPAYLKFQTRPPTAVNSELKGNEPTNGAQTEDRELLRAVIEGTSDAVYIKDLAGCYRLINAAASRMLGKSSEEVIGKDDSSLFPVEESTILMEEDRTVIAAGKTMTNQEVLTDSSGKQRIFLSTKGPLFDENGHITGLFGITRDITDLKRTGEALQKNHAELEQRVAERTAALASTVKALQIEIHERKKVENQLIKSAEEIRDLYDNAPCGYHSLDKNGLIIRINATELNWLGYSQEEIEGKLHLPDLMTPNSIKRFHETFPQFMQEGKLSDLEQELIRKDGTILPVSLSATAIYDKDRNFIMSRSIAFDITERKEAEQKLRRLNRLYAVLSETGNAIVHVNDQDSLFHEVCRIAVEHGGFRLAWIGQVDKATGVVNIVASQGETRYLENLFISTKGDPNEGGPTGVVLRSGQYYICNDFLNDECTRPWHDKARAHGLKASASIALKSREKVIGAFTLYAGETGYFDLQMIELFQQMAADISFTLDNLYRDARRKAAEIALQAEIEERLRTMEELREKDRIMMHQARLAAMGEMIGNIAHQWRQPLNTLGLVIQRLPFFYETNEFSKEFLEASTGEAMKLIQHMSRTIDDFRNFFRTDKEKINFNINQVIRQTVNLVKGGFKNEQIDITINCDDIPSITGFPNEYSQVLISILHNARDALSERKIKHARISIHAFVKDGRITVIISDNAGGIDKNIIDKIFDPYFTTKGPDKGTGIGLFMAKNIIENSMNGHLTVRNTDEGAEFKIEV